MRTTRSYTVALAVTFCLLPWGASLAQEPPAADFAPGVTPPPLPRYATVGRCGTHHLAEDEGTADYYWNGSRWLTTLELATEQQPQFWIYQEREYPGYYWAFRRGAGRWVDVWFFVPGSSPIGGHWVYFHTSCKRIPVNAYGPYGAAARMGTAGRPRPGAVR